MNDWALVLALLWPAVVTGLSITVTVEHAVDEVVGDGGPLWSEFGRIAGVRVPDWLGVLGVSVVLPTSLAVAAVYGYLSGCETALSLLVGARLGDALFSHAGLWLAGLSRPNPGLPSSVLCALEGLVGACFLTVSPVTAVAAGLGFAAVIPSLWLVGRARIAHRIVE